MLYIIQQWVLLLWFSIEHYSCVLVFVRKHCTEFIILYYWLKCMYIRPFWALRSSTCLAVSLYLIIIANPVKSKLSNAQVLPVHPGTFLANCRTFWPIISWCCFSARQWSIKRRVLQNHIPSFLRIKLRYSMICMIYGYVA